jgi:hypothetical protein
MLLEGNRTDSEVGGLVWFTVVSWAFVLMAPGTVLGSLVGSSTILWFAKARDVALSTLVRLGTVSAAFVVWVGVVALCSTQLSHRGGITAAVVAAPVLLGADGFASRWIVERYTSHP